MILIFFDVHVYITCVCQCAVMCTGAHVCGYICLWSPTVDIVCLSCSFSTLLRRQGLSIKPRTQQLTRLSSQLAGRAGTTGNSPNSLAISGDSGNPNSSPHACVTNASPTIISPFQCQGIYKWHKFITASSGSSSVHNQQISKSCVWLMSVSHRWCLSWALTKLLSHFPHSFENWIHSCGWSLYDSTTFPKTPTLFFLTFLFILWRFPVMYFDYISPFLHSSQVYFPLPYVLYFSLKPSSAICPVHIL